MTKMNYCEENFDAVIGVTAELEIREDEQVCESEEGFNKSNESMYLSEIGKLPLLDKETELALVVKAQTGDLEARSRLFNANQRLVYNIAKQYRQQGTDIMDLVQEGNMGLFRALEKFNTELGHRFSTYATWWVDQNIRRYIMRDCGLKIPYHILELKKKIKRVSSEIFKQEGRYPDAAEVAARLKEKPEKVSELMAFNTNITNLETPLGEDGGDLYDVIEDADLPGPESVLEAKALKSLVKKAIDSLSEREAQVLKYRMGFIDNKTYTLEEVGKKLNITRERVRQIEATALRRLRNSSMAAALSCYIAN